MTWIKLNSALTGQGDVYVKEEYVLSVTGCHGGEYTTPNLFKEGPRSVVTMHASDEESYYVLGTPEEVVAKLESGEQK